jgi:hypothetical protein
MNIQNRNPCILIFLYIAIRRFFVLENQQLSYFYDSDSYFRGITFASFPPLALLALGLSVPHSLSLSQMFCVHDVSWCGWCKLIFLLNVYTICEYCCIYLFQYTGKAQLALKPLGTVNLSLKSSDGESR